MDFRRALILPILVAMIGMVWTGCSSSNGGPAAATPTSDVAPQATPSPRPRPVLNGGVYTFASKGYSVRQPDGWTLLPDATYDVAGARYPTDTFFFGNTVIDGIQPSISISCLKPRAEQDTTAQFRDSWQTFVQQLSGKPVSPSIVTVGQEKAFSFEYVQSQENGAPTTADRTDVIFATTQCRWLITLLAPVGHQTDYQAALATVLSSFNSSPQPGP